MTPDDHPDLEQQVADLKERLWAATNAAGWGDIGWGEARALRFELDRSARELERLMQAGYGG